MKTIILRFLLLALLLALPSCSKKPVEVTGQIFVITQGRENIKMGGVEVLVIPDDVFVKKAKEVVAWMQQEARAEAQRRADSDHMTGFINEVIELEKTTSLKIPELPKIRESIVRESDFASEFTKSLMVGGLQRGSLIKMFAGDGEKMVFTTDADGRFTLPLKGKAWFHAMAERKVGDNTEGYIWLKGFEAPDGVSNASLVISNDDDINDEDELYAMLTDACKVQGQLEDFRNVEVSDKMKSLVQRFREEMDSATAKAEEAYKKFAGSRAGEEKVMEIAPGVTMTFCWCPPGEFMMGSSLNTDRWIAKYLPKKQVKVSLRNGFWIGKKEVTQVQWQAVMGNNPSTYKNEDSLYHNNMPVTDVSWYDVQDFFQKVDVSLAKIDGGIARLPSEAQWEYAARAGQSGDYGGGDRDEVAWTYFNYYYQGDRSPEDAPINVGTRRANAWGIHDMIGNAEEWCQDWYTENLSSGIASMEFDSAQERVLRGGCINFSERCHVAARHGRKPDHKYCSLGFRVVRISGP